MAEKEIRDMNLLDELAKKEDRIVDLLKRLKGLKELNKNTRLKIVCVDGIVVEGFYRGYTSACDNEPEIPQLDIKSTKNGGLIGILENEIKEVEIIKSAE